MCGGASGDGRLFGNGETQPISRPVRLGTDTWRLVDPEWNHVVAIQSDGSLWTWGSMADGTTLTEPTRIGLRTDWTAVVAGDGFSLGLTEDGTLWVWGDNESGAHGTARDTSNPARVQDFR